MLKLHVQKQVVTCFCFPRRFVSHLAPIFPVSYLVYPYSSALSPKIHRSSRDGSGSRGYSPSAARRRRARDRGEGAAHYRSAVPLLEAAQGPLFPPLPQTANFAYLLYHPFRVAKFSPPYNFLSIRLVKKLICDL